jgi:uncharacterized protein YjiK
MSAELERIGRSRVPLPEVSGLSSSYDGSTTTLVAVGDDRVSFAVARVDPDGTVGEWTVLTTADVGARGDREREFLQLEAAALDGQGRVWVLTEETSRLAGVDIGARAVVATAVLDTSTIPELHASWSKAGASRGEGLLLLESGHVLVAKEKEPAGLVEFGPEGDAAQGVSAATVLRPGSAYDVGTPRLVALGWWPLGRSVAALLEDLSDLAPDHEGGVWLLSDQSRRFARMVLPLEPGGVVELGEVVALPHRIGKPEGLAFLPGGLVAVSDDRHDEKDNLWVFGR